MTKDVSGRPGAEGSAHFPSPLENDDSRETLTREGQVQKSVELTTKSSPSSLIEEPNKSADINISIVREAESQPMTASSSTSSIPSLKDGSGSGTGPTGSAAPYGTRSRNRTGASRPNYAEDKEMETDFEISASAKENDVRKIVVRSADQGPTTTTLDSGRPINNTRKVVDLEAGQTATMIRSHSKDPIPGTSTFSANPAAAGIPTQPSKKRKAIGQPATNSMQTQHQNHTLQGTPTAQAVTRRASMAAQVVAGFRDSNMLSFDNCGGRLSGKRLVADDGTILEINGKLEKHK